MARELQSQLSPPSLPPAFLSPSVPPNQPSAFGTPYVTMDPPSPPSLPPRSDGISFSFFIIAAVVALIAACAFLILQWVACAYIMPVHAAWIQRSHTTVSASVVRIREP